MRPKILTKPITIEELSKAKEIQCYLDITDDGEWQEKIIIRPDRNAYTGNTNFPYFSKGVILENVKNPKRSIVKEYEGKNAYAVLDLINGYIYYKKLVKFFSDPKYLSGFRTCAPSKKCTPAVKVDVRKMF